LKSNGFFKAREVSNETRQNGEREEEEEEDIRVQTVLPTLLKGQTDPADR
jgi:hypothetical protein